MGYWKNTAEYNARGIDFDLAACLDNNEQPGFTVDDIARVLGVYEGEHDSYDWRWLVKLSDGRYASIQGGCDYTGWDCQSSADSAIFTNVADALRWFKTVDRWDSDRNTDAWQAIARQLTSTKDQTWHERTGKDMGLLS